ncbi:MAG: Holliday junction branch migration protein RuvA [Coriobacteriales bacterium]
MITSLRGVVLDKSADSVVIEVGGMGFRVGMSTHALGSLPPVGETAFVYTCLMVREDALSLFGFVDTEERSLFQSLVGVSGVGPKVALAALSTYAPSELVSAITAGDVKAVSAVPGIGRKTAQRIVLELKGTLADEEQLQQTLADGASDASAAEAVAALLGMGFTSAEADKALHGFEGSPTDVEEMIRYALKRLGSSR